MKNWPRHTVRWLSSACNALTLKSLRTEAAVAAADRYGETVCIESLLMAVESK